MPRWLRVTRFYRGDPSFDRVSDERCETLVVQARVQRGDAAWIVPGALAILIGAVVAGFGFLVTNLIMQVAGGGGGGGSATVSAVAGGGVPAASGTAPGNALATVLQLMNLTVASAVMVVVFVAVQRTMLLRSMRRILNKAVCPYCDFSLTGLIAEYGKVRCPECGQSIVLAEHRLTEEDLIPETPEGLRAMREHWRKQGADKFGALTGGAPIQNGPRGSHTTQLPRVEPTAKRR